MVNKALRASHAGGRGACNRWRTKLAETGFQQDRYRNAPTVKGLCRAIVVLKLSRNRRRCMEPASGGSRPDPDLERIMGEIYADLAMRHAREIRQPDFISMVMAAIFYKTTHGFIRMGSLEQGFIGRISQLSYLGSLN
jgi:hypothetical protein